MTLVQWALPQLTELLPLDEESLKEIIVYTDTLPDAEAVTHLTGLLGESPKASEFITSFNACRSALAAEKSKQPNDVKPSDVKPSDVKEMPPAYAPPSYPVAPQSSSPSYPVAPQSTSMFLGRPHTNPVIEAANVRAKDEVCLILTFSIKLSRSYPAY
jgi:hypothetical protein